MNRGDPLRRLSWCSVLGYGLGDVGNNLVFAMGTFFLLSYYTDVVGLPLLAAGTLMTSVKIYCACTDLAMGRIVDRSTTRWGKFRPFILFGALPMLGLNVAVFSVPTSWSLSGKLMYAGVTYALLGTAYSVVNMSYGSLASAITQDAFDRARLGASRTIMSVATASVLTILVGPSLAALQGDAQQTRLTLMTLVEAGLGAMLFALCFLTTSESVPRRMASPEFHISIRTVWRNRPLLVLCGCMVLTLSGYMCSGASLIYFARHVSSDPKGFFLFLGILGLVSATAVFIAGPTLVRALGKQTTVLLSLGTCFAGYLALYIGICLNSNAIVITAFVLTSIGIRFVMSTVWAMEADTIEYGEWLTGARVEGLTYATFSLARKLGQALGVSVPAILLAWGDYKSGATMQSASALRAIAQAVGLAPAVSMLGAFCLMCFYPLSDRIFSIVLRAIRIRDVASRNRSDGRFVA